MAWQAGRDGVRIVMVRQAWRGKDRCERMAGMVTIAELRSLAPAVSWRAERYGMGHRYIGNDGAFIVYATSVISGPAEDDLETVWRIDHDGISEPVSSWLIRFGVSITVSPSQRQDIVLTPEQFDSVVEMVENPPPPSEALVKLMRGI